MLSFPRQTIVMPNTLHGKYNVFFFFNAIIVFIQKKEKRNSQRHLIGSYMSREKGTST